MTAYRTSRELDLIAFGIPIKVPAGTALVPSKGGMGVDYAVASQAWLVAMTGNTHDPKYRFVFVPKDAVESY